MWYLIVSIPDLCTLTYFNVGHQNNFGATNTGYEFKNFTPSLLTDRFLLKHTSGNVNFLHAKAHTEINGLPIGILGQVWCLIVSIPDLCPRSYFFTTVL